MRIKSLIKISDRFSLILVESSKQFNIIYKTMITKCKPIMCALPWFFFFFIFLHVARTKMNSLRDHNGYNFIIFSIVYKLMTHREECHVTIFFQLSKIFIWKTTGRERWTNYLWFLFFFQNNNNSYFFSFTFRGSSEFLLA